MRLAAEMIVPGAVEDDFGLRAEPTCTYLRYEVRLGLVEPEGRQKLGRLVLISESLKPITQGDAVRRLAQPLAANPTFRNAVVRNKRRGVAYISTTVTDNGAVISLHQDGGSRGQPRRAAAGRAPTTVVRTITSADDPTVMAARREMQSWRRLALEPSAMRDSDRYVDPRVMESDGAHLAGALHRIATDPAGAGDAEAVYARVASHLDRLCGLRVDAVRIDEDDTRQQLSLELVERGGLTVPARNLSEGTLRFLALCVLLEDPMVQGLLCLEEPENGIHPANVPAMIDLVRRLAVDTDDPPGPDNPFRQVVINTHSPAVVQIVGSENLLFATRRRGRSPEFGEFLALDLIPMAGSWRAPRGDGSTMTKADVLPYLTQVPDALFTLTA
jgi:predicted ATPase